MRALILWADDRSANLGVRVLARGAALLAEQAVPGASIDYQDLAPNAAGFSPTIGVVRRDIGRPNGPIKRWLRDYDLVVDTGAGDSFADIYGWRRVFRMMYVQLTARRLGIPVVLAPQTVGPFTTRRMRLMARRAISRASIVMARDHASLAAARSLGRRDVELSTDLVFALPQPPSGRARYDVLLNVSGLLWTSDSHGDSRSYRAAVDELIAGLVARGRRVALLAHVLENVSPDSDVRVVRDLAAAHALEALVPRDLDEVRTMVAGAELVIGSRMHACLNALSTGTPAIAWAYSRKFAPLLQDIGWPHTIDLREPDVAARTLAIVDAHSPEELGRQLAATTAVTRGRVEPLAGAVAALLTR